MSDKRTGKKKKKIRPDVTETPDLSQQAPVNGPKPNSTPAKNKN